MVTGARVGKALGLDVITVLAADPEAWMVRLAAALILQEDERKADAARHKQR